MAKAQQETPAIGVPDPKVIPPVGEDGPEADLQEGAQDWVWSLLQGPLEPYVARCRTAILVGVGLYAVAEEMGLVDAARSRLSKLGKRIKR